MWLIQRLRFSQVPIMSQNSQYTLCNEKQLNCNRQCFFKHFNYIYTCFKFKSHIKPRRTILVVLPQLWWSIIYFSNLFWLLTIYRRTTIHIDMCCKWNDKEVRVYYSTFSFVLLFCSRHVGFINNWEQIS